MDKDEFKAKKALQLVWMIYFALLGGITFFLIVVLLIVSGQASFKVDFSDPLILVLLILTISALPVSLMISKKHFSKVDPSSSLRTKFQIYQTGQIMRLALCEGVSLFAIILLLISNNLFALVFLFISLAVIVLYFPTPNKIGIDISLTETEIEQFYK